MATKAVTAYSKLLEKYKIVLTNAGNNPIIKNTMENFGYSEQVLKEGWELYRKTRKIYDQTNRHYKNQLAANEKLKAAKEKLALTYSRHRKLAKIILKKDPNTLMLMNLHRKIPRTFSAWMDAVDIFYSFLKNHPEILEKLSRVKINEDSISTALKEYADVEEAYRLHILQKGIAQSNTDLKIKTFKEMQDWTSAYIAAARIAFIETPQQLESLGIVVKSRKKKR